MFALSVKSHLYHFCLFKVVFSSHLIIVEKKFVSDVLRDSAFFVIKVTNNLPKNTIGLLKNKTGMDRLQDCCKAKATKTLLLDV